MSQVNKDTALLERVRDRMMSDQRLGGQILNVTADEGFIVISGHVDTEANKQLALDIARGVSGVRNIKDSIEVRQWC